MTKQKSKQISVELSAQWLRQFKSKIEKDGLKAGLSSQKIKKLATDFEQSLSKTKLQNRADLSK